MPPDPLSLPVEHTPFEILIEADVRGELAPEDRAPLEAHLAACAACREHLERATREAAMLISAATAFAGTFDFDRVRRASHALVHVRRRESLSLLLWVGAFVALSLGGMVASGGPTVWVVIALAVFVALPLVLLLLKDALLERRARGLSALEDADEASGRFEAQVRRSLNLFTLNQLGVLVVLALLLVFAYRWHQASPTIAGLAPLALFAVVAAWQWRRTLSPGARRREADFLRGDLPLDQYLRERSLWRFLRQRPEDNSRPSGRA